MLTEPLLDAMGVPELRQHDRRRTHVDGLGAVVGGHVRLPRRWHGGQRLHHRPRRRPRHLDAGTCRCQHGRGRDGGWCRSCRERGLLLLLLRWRRRGRRAGRLRRRCEPAKEASQRPERRRRFDIRPLTPKRCGFSRPDQWTNSGLGQRGARRGQCDRHGRTGHGGRCAGLELVEVDHLNVEQVRDLLPVRPVRFAPSPSVSPRGGR